MEKLETLENKIRQSIPELREEYEIFQESAIDFDMITQIMLNHVLEYAKNKFDFIIPENYSYIQSLIIKQWDLKSSYLKNQSTELITYLNKLT